MEATHEQRQHEENRLQALMSRIISTLPISQKGYESLSDILSFDQDEVISQNINHMDLRILEGFDSLL
jgi:hypothetical protein